MPMCYIRIAQRCRDTVTEVYRTLKPSDKAIFNTWRYVPNFRLRLPPKPRGPRARRCYAPGSEKWSQAEYLRRTMEKGGCEKDNTVIERDTVLNHYAEMDHDAKMLWSFIGSTTTRRLAALRRGELGQGHRGCQTGSV
ncbi:hypothetical protein F4808DRAFT_414755 [Astrocystis sublimbata]|nr:hypothetical protein F4808DRAFT_414755 [Astrocystis sublimbata]